MCMHHIVLGNLLKYYNVNIKTFSGGFDVVLHAMSHEAPEQELKDEFLQKILEKYKKEECFKTIRNVIYSKEILKEEDYSESHLGLCYTVSKRMKNLIEIDKTGIPDMLECPIDNTKGFLFPNYNLSFIVDCEKIKDISGPRHFYLHIRAI